MKKIYIAGSSQSIKRAEELGLFIIQMGGLPIIPYTIYRYWDNTFNNALLLACRAELLDMCDAVCVTSYAKHHVKTAEEINYAGIHGIRVFYSALSNDMSRFRTYLTKG